MVWHLDQLLPYQYTVMMKNRVRKITINVPLSILERATHVTGQGITTTVIAGLQELDKKAQRSALRKLKGKIHFDLDLDESRK